MTEFKPWDSYPSLTEDRLEIIAGLIRTARQNAVRCHDPSFGDDVWVLGCRAYRWTCYSIEKGVPHYPWLEVLDDFEHKTLRFTFAIGGLPVRFYRGTPNDPPSSSLATTYTELHQLQKAFDFGVEFEPAKILRLAIETDAKGLSSKITLVELSEDELQPSRIYEIPNQEAVQRQNIPTHAKPIDLPAIVVEPLEDDDNDEKKVG